MAEADLSNVTPESENDAPEADSEGARGEIWPQHMGGGQELDVMDHTESDCAEGEFSPEDMEGAEADLQQEGVEADFPQEPNVVVGNGDALPNHGQVLTDQMNVEGLEIARSPSPAEADMMALGEEAESSAAQNLSQPEEKFLSESDLHDGSSRSDSPAEEDRASTTDSHDLDMTFPGEDAGEAHADSCSAEASGAGKRDSLISSGDQDSGPENGFQDLEPESATVESELVGSADAVHTENFNQEQKCQSNKSGFLVASGSNGSELPESAESCEPECDWGSQGALASGLSPDMSQNNNGNSRRDLVSEEHVGPVLHTGSSDSNRVSDRLDSSAFHASDKDLASWSLNKPECGDTSYLPSPQAYENDTTVDDVEGSVEDSKLPNLTPDDKGDCLPKQETEGGHSQVFDAIQAGIQEAINKSSSFLDSDPPSTADNSEQSSPCHQPHLRESASEPSPGLPSMSKHRSTPCDIGLQRKSNPESDSDNSQTNTDAIPGDVPPHRSDAVGMVTSHIPNDGNKNTDSDCQRNGIYSTESSCPIQQSQSIEASSSTCNLVKDSDKHAQMSSLICSSDVKDLSGLECKVSSGSDNAFSEEPEDELLNELNAELVTDSKDCESRALDETVMLPNGVQKFSLTALPKYQKLKASCRELEEEIENIKGALAQKSSSHETVVEEKRKLEAQLKHLQEKNKDEIYESLIKELEVKTVALEQELKLSKGKLQSHDAAAKRTVTALQGELRTRVEQITKLYEDCKKEKETMTVRYAQAEQKNIEMSSRVSQMERRMKEIAREREVMIQRFHELKADRNKAASLFESKNQEMAALRRDLDRLKDGASSQEVKVKWAQNKLRAELESHKETKGKLEEAHRKIKEAKEETEMIRSDCQAMVRKYQESEELKSVTLDKELRVKAEQLQMQKQEKTDQEEVYYIVLRELESLKKKHKDALEENKTWKDKVQAQELERTSQEQHLDRYRETLQKQKSEIAALNKRVAEQQQMENDFKVVKSKWDAMEKRVAELEESNQEIQGDMSNCAKRESESLLFTQKLSDKNAKLQSENTTLNTKVLGLSAEVERLTQQVDDLQSRNGRLNRDLEEERRLRKEENEMLSMKLGEKAKAVEQLSIQVEEERDENRTLKRKHVANTKDLTRQLQQAKKRLEAMENKDSTSQGSMGSRTPSNGSLDTLNNHNNAGANTGPVSRTPSLESPPQEEYEPVVRVVEVDKQMLVEKIVRLQKAHARKNEKLEFMEDHINQLLEEVRKKNKIIQHYALREEAGTLSPEVSDENKAQIAKKGGIMASLYSSHSQDGTMTLDLSLDINRKLQAVLEDTLLKNITLKDNLQTLGEEIARLSQENRQIQLHMRSGQKTGH